MFGSHEKPIVAFLGPKASYTHQVSRRHAKFLEKLHEDVKDASLVFLDVSRQATLTAFAEDKYEIQPQTSIEDVFAAVQAGSAAYGVVPFENSTNGSVIFTLDLLADMYNRYPDILVEGEIYLPVHHCLLGHPARIDSGKTTTNTPTKYHLPWRKLDDTPNTASNSSGAVTPTQKTPNPAAPRVKPSQDISHVKKLYSHPQAWGQCKLFLNAYLKGIERQDVSSTSKAAEFVAQDPSGTSAAISSRIAARLNGLECLAENIEDNEGNSTRFLLIRRPGETIPPTISSPATTDDDMASYKSLIAFQVQHDNPGSLADCLAVLKKFSLNLTSINTRPSGEAPWHYVFFVECQGRKLTEGGAVNAALEELKDVASSMRFLGSWHNELK